MGVRIHAGFKRFSSYIFYWRVFDPCRRWGGETKLAPQGGRLAPLRCVLRHTCALRLPTPTASGGAPQGEASPLASGPRLGRSLAAGHAAPRPPGPSGPLRGLNGHAGTLRLAWQWEGLGGPFPHSSEAL